MILQNKCINNDGSSSYNKYQQMRDSAHEVPLLGVPAECTALIPSAQRMPACHVEWKAGLGAGADVRAAVRRAQTKAGSMDGLWVGGEGWERACLDNPANGAEQKSRAQRREEEIGVQPRSDEEPLPYREDLPMHTHVATNSGRGLLKYCWQL